MSWIKLNFLEYDVENINAEGYFISHKSHCIMDLNCNEIVNIPFLLDNDYNLYKTELSLVKKKLIIFIYINFDKLEELIKQNKLIPCRNQLFEILKRNIDFFKFNKKIFDEVAAVPLKNQISNLLTKSLYITKAISNNVINYKNIYIDLNLQNFNIEIPKKTLLISSFLVYYINQKKCLTKIFETIASKKILFVYKTQSDLPNKMLKITPKNYKKISLKKILSNNLIGIDVNLIKKKKYYDSYFNFHSKNILDMAYYNFKNYINKVDFNDIPFYNLELLKFDTIFYNNILSFNDSNLTFFMKKISADKKIFLENINELDFNYSNFLKIRDSFLCKDKYNLDITLNTNLIKHNVFFETVRLDENIKITYSKYNNDITINHNLEKILDNNGISFKIGNHKFGNDELCPIEYIPFNETIVAKLSCGHCFTLNSLVKSLCHSSTCPICTKSLIYENITIVAKPEKLRMYLFGKIYNLINFNYYNLFIINDIDNMRYMNNRLEMIFLDNVVKFTTIENIDVNNISYKNIIVHIDRDFYNSNFRFSIINTINKLNYENKELYLNLIN